MYIYIERYGFTHLYIYIHKSRGIPLYMYLVFWVILTVSPISLTFFN